jgi:L-ornithine Nalpha-acyltransferase
MSLRVFPTVGEARLLPSRRRRDLNDLGPSLGVAGTLEVRLATTKREIRQAQKLRYRVFFENGGASADATARLIKRDVCRFDGVCDHLIVLDHAARDKRGRARLVGAYRLLRQDAARANFGFYSAAEFDLAPLLARHADKNFLELGRSCVAPDYRGKPALELLWRGIWTYVRHHRVDALFGCASFAGADPAAHAAALRFLQRRAPTRPEWSAPAAAGQGVAISGLADAAIIADARAALRALPPLLKGYWRVGAQFGAEVVSDAKFGTTDIFVIMPVAEIDQRYIRFFGDERDAAPLAA